MNKVDQVELNKLKQKLSDFMAKYQNGNVTKEELKSFCELVVDYCKITRHSDCKLERPTLSIKVLEEKDTLGYYIRSDNSITLNEDYLDKILRKESNLSELINTIGHEMTHYNQNSSMRDYDKMSVRDQELVSSDKKESISSYKNYQSLNLTERDIELIHTLLSPYLKKGQAPEGYEGNIQDYYYDISYASYYTIVAEKEAREEGNNFAKMFFTEFQKKKKKAFSFIKKKDELETIEESISKENESFVNNTKRVKKFSNLYSSIMNNDETIFEIAGKLETMENKFEYVKALNFLIKNRTLEQKQSLLKNAIYNGHSLLTEILVESIQNDINFKKNKDKASKLVLNCLTGKEYNGQKEINYAMFFKDYSKIMNQSDFEKLAEETLKKDGFNAKNIYGFAQVENCSLNALLNYQEIVSKGKNRNSVDDRQFFENVFTNLTIKNKIEFLKCDKLEPNVRKILIDKTITDKNYKDHKSEIDAILNPSKPQVKTQPVKTNITPKQPVTKTETIATGKTPVQATTGVKGKASVVEEVTPEVKEGVVDVPKVKEEIVDVKVDVPEIKEEVSPVVEEPVQNGNENETLRQRFDISTEQGMNNLFVSYAELNQKYYDKNHKRTPEEIRKRRNLNAQMKRILQSKLKEEKEENSGLDLNTYVNQNFSDNLIEEVAKSKGATLKLFNIMASGVYEKDGERIRLTQKQRQALASVLEKVSEKRLNIDSPEKIAKGDLTNAKAVERGE